MTTVAFSRNSWAELERDEARFHRTVLMVLVPFIILGILIPLWELAGLKEGGGEELSDRYAALLMQSAAQQEEKPAAVAEPKVETPAEEPEAEPEAEPEPAPKQETKKEPKTEPKPVAQVDARQQAKENVQKKFSSAFNALDSLREQAPVISANSRTLTAASSASESSSDTQASGVLTSNLSSGSGGVGSAPSRSSNPSNTGLAGRQTTQVSSGIKATGGGGFGPDSDKAGMGGKNRLQGRSLEEIQIVMDRNKSGLYSLYNRALRKDATLQGKVVLEITIAPSGQVTSCKVVSSELANKELENRIVSRVKLISFGAKSVAPMTIKYPIHFIPS